MQANAEMTEELNQLDNEIEALLSEQSRAFQAYMQTAQELRRALRQTAQLSDREWIERISNTTRRLRVNMDSIEINAAALTLVGQSAERTGMLHLEIGQSPTTD